jgi:hypothetical protein
MSAQSRAERNGRSTVRQPTARTTSSAITTICSMRCCDSIVADAPCAQHHSRRSAVGYGLAPAVSRGRLREFLSKHRRRGFKMDDAPSGPKEVSRRTDRRMPHSVDATGSLMKWKGARCARRLLRRMPLESRRAAARHGRAHERSALHRLLCRRSRRPAVEHAAKSGLARRIVRYCARSGGSGRPRTPAIDRCSQPARQSYQDWV